MSPAGARRPARGRSFASLIWRVDFNLDGVSLGCESEFYDSMVIIRKMKPEQPGANGVRYAIETGLCLRYRDGEEAVHASGRQSLTRRRRRVNPS